METDELRCAGCGYILEGIASDRCPECGRETKDAVRGRFHRRRGLTFAGAALLLISLYFAAARGKITVKDSLSVELAGLYWHFVDIVWVAIFTIVYLLKV